MNKDHFEQLVRARTSNSTDASFPAKVPTTTEPTGDGVLSISTTYEGWRYLKVIPYGTDAADETFKLRAIGWSRVGSLWVPTVLAECTCTLGTAPGVAGESVGDEELFADTITLDTGNSNVSAEVLSPTGDLVAHVILDVKGNEKVEITFDRNSSSASCNALVARL